MLKTMGRDFVKFVKHNPLYLLCSVIYYVLSSLILGAQWYSFLIAFAFYAISLAIAFSPLGEKLLRLTEQIRKLEVRREKEFLQPIFDEVYGKAKQKNADLGKIELCIVEKMEINACAIGKHTVALTKGAIETFGEDELKALLAHEIAHIVHGDTIATLYAVVGNGLFTAFILLNKGFLFLVDLVTLIATRSGLARIILLLTRYSFELMILLFMFLMQAVIAINSRKNEFRADQYAFELGYGEELIECFYVLEKIQMGDNRKLIKKMTASHPRITARIGKLEDLSDRESSIQTDPMPLN